MRCTARPSPPSREAPCSCFQVGCTVLSLFLERAHRRSQNSGEFFPVKRNWLMRTSQTHGMSQCSHPCTRVACRVLGLRVHLHQPSAQERTTLCGKETPVPRTDACLIAPSLRSPTTRTLRSATCVPGKRRPRGHPQCFRRTAARMSMPVSRSPSVRGSHVTESARHGPVV